MKRIGKRQQAFFRVVVADQRVQRDGKVIEDLGYYQPWSKAKKLQITKDRYEYWIKNGAVPTLTVKQLFRRLEKEAKGKTDG
jgi:small subunit ribosomal protein S16